VFHDDEGLQMKLSRIGESANRGRDWQPAQSAVLVINFQCWPVITAIVGRNFMWSLRSELAIPGPTTGTRREPPLRSTMQPPCSPSRYPSPT
jgi:hypothetical protein